MLNKGQVGYGVSAGSAGIRVDRGDSPDYMVIFDEADDLFKVGELGDEEIIATRPYVLSNALTPANNLSDVTNAANARQNIGTNIGSNIDAGSLPADRIIPNTITATQIATNAVGAAELANNAVDTMAIVNGAVSDDKIASGINAAKITNGTMSGERIANNTITALQIANNAVGATQLANNAVGAAQLANNAVDTTAILNTAVTNDKLATGIDAAKLIGSANINRLTLQNSLPLSMKPTAPESNSTELAFHIGGATETAPAYIAAHDPSVVDNTFLPALTDKPRKMVISASELLLQPGNATGPVVIGGSSTINFQDNALGRKINLWGGMETYSFGVSSESLDYYSDSTHTFYINKDTTTTKVPEIMRFAHSQRYIT